MIELGISNLTKMYGVDKIFENVTFDVKTKDKIKIMVLGFYGTVAKMRFSDEISVRLRRIDVYLKGKRRNFFGRMTKILKSQSKWYSATVPQYPKFLFCPYFNVKMPL